MSIVKLTPAFKDYLWGGTKLKENYGKKTDMDPVAESWELSVHPDGPSIVASGEYEGLSFPEYLEKKGKGVLGTKGNTFEFFPILIKFIDAKQPLSIQVHPDNEYALRVEHEYGKTEMWYILDCEPDSLFRMDCDLVAMAIGQKVDFTPLNDDLKTTDTHASTLKNVYIIGDAFTGPKTIGSAVMEGKKIAKEIEAKYNEGAN